MHYQKYNEYINTINVPSCDNMSDIMGNMQNNVPNMHMHTNNMSYNDSYNVDLESMYPETYKIIYPMVCSACDMVQMPVTKELIMIITDDIYNRLKIERSIDVGEDRQRNMFLNDLINVLLIRELIQRRPNFPNRPPRPIRPFWGF